MAETGRYRIAAVELDSRSILRLSAEIEHERRVAIFDLLQENHFRPCDDDEGGPYRLTLSIEDNRLLFDIATMEGAPRRKLLLALTPFRKIVKDYFAICDSYYQAIKSSIPLQRLEAIDMGRRGVHNEGSELLRARLAGKIDIDMETARRLFTLVCVLHIRG